MFNFKKKMVTLFYLTLIALIILIIKKRNFIFSLLSDFMRPPLSNSTLNKLAEKYQSLKQFRTFLSILAIIYLLGFIISLFYFLQFDISYMILIMLPLVLTSVWFILKIRNIIDFLFDLSNKGAKNRINYL